MGGAEDAGMQPVGQAEAASADHTMQSPVLADPKPEAPIEPALEDCCGSGCDPCVFDLYTADLHRYRADLAAWEARQTAARA